MARPLKERPVLSGKGKEKFIFIYKGYRDDEAWFRGMVKEWFKDVERDHRGVFELCDDLIDMINRERGRVNMYRYYDSRSGYFLMDKYLIIWVKSIIYDLRKGIRK